MPAATPVEGTVQGSAQWLDARRNVVGSSDIPVITGSTPYGTSEFSLWAQKTRLADPEPVDPETQELFDLGHALEDPIAALYTARTGRPLRRARRLLIHPTERWMGASLDRVSARKGERRIVEIKWVPHRRWATDGPEPVPAYVQDQVQWQLAVTGYDVADVAVLSGSHVEVHEIGPDLAYQDDLRYIARAFWDRVERGERPPVDGSEATRLAIGRIHPRDTMGLMVPTAEVRALVYALREARAAKKAATEEDGRLANELRLALGEYAGVEDEDYRVHFRRSADSIVTTTDWAAVADAYREIAQRQAELVGADIVPELDAIASLQTTTETKEGRRALIPKWRGDDGRWT